jgi:hypothetical protein
VLEKPSEDLMCDDERWWGVKTTSAESALSEGKCREESPPDVSSEVPWKMALAYRQSPAPNSTLAFLVSMLSLLSSVPVLLDSTHSTHQVGSISDADFYQLISSSILQLLSTATMIIPTIYNVRLAALT